MKKLVEKLANLTGQPAHVILTGKDGRREFVEIRQILSWQLRQLGYTALQISRMTGYNRCTVIYGTKVIQNLIDTDDERVLNIINRL